MPGPADLLRTTAVALPSQPHVALGRPALAQHGSDGNELKNVSTLVAGAVPGRVDFTSDTPMPTAALPLYRHPADRNAAATGVHAGQLIDISA